MKLSDIQSKFQDHMVRATNEIDNDFSKLYEEGQIPIDERLKVYRDNVIGGLASTMKDIYPTITALTGEEFTLGMLRVYIRDNLPKTGCLEDYAHDFPEFIRTFKPAKSLPYLADIARLDHALSICEHAEDDRALSQIEMQKYKDIEMAQLNLRMSVFLVGSPFPIISIHKFSRKSEDEQAEPPNLKNNPEYALIYRPYLKAEYILLTKEEFDFLTLLQKDSNVINALELILPAHQGFDFQRFLQKFISLETFRSV